MTKLHELLAVEKTKVSAVNKLLEDTSNKFSKEHFFSGHLKTLSMLKDSIENKAVEESGKELKVVPTTVEETLEYLFTFWADAEDILYSKNKSNLIANGDIIYKDSIIATAVPVDELMGLESRLEVLRKLMDKMPTLDAGKEWVSALDGRPGSYKLKTSESTVKTEKVTTPVILYPATDHHPAQVKESVKDETVGTFTRILYSGAATSKQKADVLSTIDDLIVSVKQARMRANSVEVSKDKIGNILTSIILDSFK